VEAATRVSYEHVGGVCMNADDLRRRPLRVALTPLPSLHCALVDAVGTGAGGTPIAWRRAIREHLHDRDYEILAPLARSPGMQTPVALLGLPDPPGESFKSAIERVIATPEQDLVAAAFRARRGTSARIEVVKDPRRRLHAYAVALLHAWKGFRPVWHNAQSALDREMRRIGVAVASDAQLELLDGLFATAHLDGGCWKIGYDHSEGCMLAPETGLVLMPLVVGAGCSIIDVAGQTVRRIGYPVPSITDQLSDEAPAPPVEELLGTSRAQLLRGLECPTSMGRLAEALGAVPSAATHHVHALEKAGLVLRERHGRHVLVRLTDRGQSLLALYEDVPPTPAHLAAG